MQGHYDDQIGGAVGYAQNDMMGSGGGQAPSAGGGISGGGAGGGAAAGGVNGGAAIN